MGFWQVCAKIIVKASIGDANNIISAVMVLGCVRMLFGNIYNLCDFDDFFIPMLRVKQFFIVMRGIRGKLSHGALHGCFGVLDTHFCNGDRCKCF